MRKSKEEQKRLFAFSAGGGDGLVILKGFEGMFAHPLNGLKGLEASIFLSAHFGGGKPKRNGPILPCD